MSWLKRCRWNPLYLGVVLSLISFSVSAEPGSETIDENKVNEAFSRFEWALINRANQHNERHANWDVDYGEMDRLAMQKREAQTRIADAEKLVNLYKAMGAETEAKIAEGRLESARSDLRLYQTEYNRHKKEGVEEYYPENQKQAHDRQTELLRIATNKLAEVSGGLSDPELFRLMDKVMEWKPGNRLIGAVDKRLAFGPEYHINDLVAGVRQRALDVLADWGTKEAWETIAKAAATQTLSRVKDVAVQHLLGEMTAEKAQALAATAEGREVLQKIAAFHQQKPHTFRQGTKYLDLQNPTNAPIEFQGRENHPEFRKKGAKERFIPVGEVREGRSGFREAARRQAPANRWAKLAPRFRRSTRPPAPPKPKPVSEPAPPAPAPTLAERAAAMPIGLPAPTDAPSVTTTEVVAPRSESAAPKEAPTGEAKKSVGPLTAFLQRLRGRVQGTTNTSQGESLTPPSCQAFSRLKPPTQRSD